VKLRVFRTLFPDPPVHLTEYLPLLTAATAGIALYGLAIT